MSTAYTYIHIAGCFYGALSPKVYKSTHGCQDEFGNISSSEQSSISPKKKHVDSAKELALAGPLATALAVAQQSATGAALLGTAVLQVLTRRD